MTQWNQIAIAVCVFLSIVFVSSFSLPAGEIKPPNILLAISDDQTWLHTSAHGAAEMNTPAFDQVARKGVLFNNAFAASPGCSPSRAALLTGLNTWQIKEAGTHASSFPAEFTTFPDRLEKTGYHIGFTGKGWGPGNWEISQRSRNPAGPAYSEIRASKTPPGINKLDYAANFSAFLDARSEEDQPFFFWYGSTEPHRSYKKGAGVEQGKDPQQVKVPEFLPDDPEIRSDLLDYFVEIEWFDKHLGRMLAELEKRGELQNTMIIVTADNGMPFPRAKANCYEYGIHMPLAICWPEKIPGGRTVDDLVGFVDLTATILQVAGVEPDTNGPPLAGKSLLNLLTGSASDLVEADRRAVFSARERHSSSRYNNWTYPQRSIRTQDYLLIRNFKPDRWPAGDPQSFAKNGKLGPLHGAYHDIDACPSLTFLVEHRDDPKVAPYFHAAVDKRLAIELFDIRKDPACMNNLAELPEYRQQKEELLNELLSYLKQTGDPRVIDGGEIYESYPRYSAIRKFPAPQTQSAE